MSNEKMRKIKLKQKLTNAPYNQSALKQLINEVRLPKSNQIQTVPVKTKRKKYFKTNQVIEHIILESLEKVLADLENKWYHDECYKYNKKESKSCKKLISKRVQYRTALHKWYHAEKQAIAARKNRENRLKKEKSIAARLKAPVPNKALRNRLGQRRKLLPWLKRKA